MKKLFLIIIALFSPLAARALSSQAERIFSKERRVIPPPPRTLLAERGPPTPGRYAYRVATESSRTSRAPRQPAAAHRKKYKDIEVSTQPVKEEEIEEVAEEASAVEEQPVTEPYAKKKSKKRSSQSENGEYGANTDSEVERDKNFGLGLVGGGAYGIFGAEIAFKVDDQWSAGFGLGTGMSYDTWGLQSRYHFREGTFSPFVQGGYANWYLRRISRTGEKVKPEYLANRFFDDKNGQLSEEKRLHLLYGGIGVLYQGTGGVATSVQLQYFIHLRGFEGGLFGALGVYYYF